MTNNIINKNNHDSLSLIEKTITEFNLEKLQTVNTERIYNQNTQKLENQGRQLNLMT